MQHRNLKKYVEFEKKVRFSSHSGSVSGSGIHPDPDTDAECEEKRTFFSNSKYFF